ncbi:MAG: Fe-S cluster assembly protein SufB, partial [Spirosomataceae bacterium]
MGKEVELLEEITSSDYKYGFYTDIEVDEAPPGLDEGIIRFISDKKQEPEWMYEWRLKAFRMWKEMEEPKWPNVTYPPIDFQAIKYYSAPKKKKKVKSLDDIDPELRRTFERLGISLSEQKRLAGVEEEGTDVETTTPQVAVDAVMDSESVITTFKKELNEKGIIFCSIAEAIREHPELVKKYLGSVVPPRDNFYAALNSAVFSDGSFVYIPKGVRCPMELSTYFRINAA